MKISNQTIFKPLTYPINFSFSSGVFPGLLKISNVIPVFKRGKSQDYNNYRSMSLTSNLTNLMEKIVHPKFDFTLLFEQKCGFRNKLSTNHALGDITKKIHTACDKRSFACGVYVYFKKTFDIVNHKLLLNKLNWYGIRGTYLRPSVICPGFFIIPYLYK